MMHAPLSQMLSLTLGENQEVVLSKVLLKKLSEFRLGSLRHQPYTSSKLSKKNRFCNLVSLGNLFCYITVILVKIFSLTLSQHLHTEYLHSFQLFSVGKVPYSSLPFSSVELASLGSHHSICPAT